MNMHIATEDSVFYIILVSLETKPNRYNVSVYDPSLWDRAYFLFTRKPERVRSNLLDIGKVSLLKTKSIYINSSWHEQAWSIKKSQLQGKNCFVFPPHRLSHIMNMIYNHQILVPLPCNGKKYTSSNFVLKMRKWVCWIILFLKLRLRICTVYRKGLRVFVMP